MRMPSLKRLQDELKLTVIQASYIRAFGHATDNPSRLETLVRTYSPATLAYVQSMHSNPYISHMWRVTVALHAMDSIMGTDGVEALGPTEGPDYSPPYEYLNTGDTYAVTLVYCRDTDTVRIGSWGDIAEKEGY